MSEEKSSVSLIKEWKVRGEDFLSRPWQEEDVGTLAKIDAQIEYTPWSKNQFKSAYENPAVTGEVITTASGEVVAYALWLNCVDVYELLTIGVRPEYRRRGFARELLTHRQSVLKADDTCESVFLEVRESNVGARALYTATGFEEVGLRKNYYATVHGFEHAVIMKWVA